MITYNPKRGYIDQIESSAEQLKTNWSTKTINRDGNILVKNQYATKAWIHISQMRLFTRVIGKHHIQLKKGIDWSNAISIETYQRILTK